MVSVSVLPDDAPGFVFVESPIQFIQMANTSHLDHFCISAHPSSMINLDANTEVVLGIYFKISVYSHTAENELLKC